MELSKYFGKPWEEKKLRKILLLARSNPNRTEKIISKSLADTQIYHEEFTLVTDEEQNYLRLK